MALIIGVAVLILLLWAGSSFSKADPKQVARLLRSLGGGAAVLFAVFLLLRGEIGPAITVGAIGLSVLGYVNFWPATLFGRTQKSPGQASRVRTAYLEMELDHDTGAMRGRVLAGAQKGASLDALDPPTLMGLLAVIDADSRDLLAAYLDRRQPGWREHAQGYAGAGERVAGVEQQQND